MDKYLVIDIETLGLDPRKGGQRICTAWATESDAPQVGTTLHTRAQERLADPTCPVVSHSKFDPIWFLREGLEVSGPYYDTMVMAHLLDENTKLDLDSCVQIYTGVTMDKRITKSTTAGVTTVWFTTDDGLKLELDQAWEKYPEQVMDYCLRDTAETENLFLALQTKMKERGWWDEYLSEHAPFTGVLIDMELSGIPINLDQSESLKAELEVQAEKQKQQLVADLGYEINFGSPKQLRTVLYSKVWQQALKVEITKEQRDCLRARCDHAENPNNQDKQEHGSSDGDQEVSKPLHYELPSKYDLDKIGTKYMYVTQMQKGLGIEPRVKTDTGEWSTSTPVLTVYHGDHPIVADLVAYRKTEKVIGTYLQTYPKFSYKDRLYGQFNQAGTATGRLSHRNPNLGNQPSHGDLGVKVRELFQGRLIVGDHSQLEPRLMAHFSGDPVLLDVYRNQRDIYLVTAEYIFGRAFSKEDEERQLCKTLILALGYGAGAPKLAQILAVNGFWTPIDRAKEYLAHLEDLYKVFFSWKNHVKWEAKTNGYVKTIGGRYRRLRYAFNDPNFRIRNKADRQAVNSIIQGSAGDIMRRNMIAVRERRPDLPLLNQVHDELLWEYLTRDTNTLEELQYICESPGYDLTVPLTFEVNYCKSWADKGTKFEVGEDDESLEE